MAFPAGYCIDCVIDDVDEVRNQAVQWGLELFQFGKGRFHSDLRAIHTEDLQLSSAWRATSLLVRGQAPRGCVTFVSVGYADSPIHFRGAALAPDEMGVLCEDDDLEINTHGATRVLTVAVEAGLLDCRMRALLGSPLEAWRVHERLRVGHPRQYDRLNHALARYLNYSLASGVTARPNSARRLEDRILETIISSIGDPPIQTPRPQRLHLAKRAEEYLRDHADTPVSVSELCEITGSNQRTLFLGFQERYGLAPMAYHKMLRLNQARRELLQSVPGHPDTSVTRLATKWGFSHLGRFSVDYRAVFGESPIETLKRPARRVRDPVSRRVQLGNGLGEPRVVLR